MTPTLWVLVDKDDRIGRCFLQPSLPAVYLSKDDAAIALKHSVHNDLRVVQYAEVAS